MKLIPLTQGLFAQVDDEDFERASQYKWCANRVGQTFYAMRNISRPEGGRKTKQYLHAYLMNTPVGYHTHHRDKNGLNDQKANLQVLSCLEHHHAERSLPQRGNASGYCGVAWNTPRRKWRARIFHCGHEIHVGRFDTAEDAARARDEKARELGWPESGMNFPL